MIVLTVSADGKELDITAKDIKAISVEAGMLMVSLQNARERLSAFVSAVKTITPDLKNDKEQTE